VQSIEPLASHHKHEEPEGENGIVDQATPEQELVKIGHVHSGQIPLSIKFSLVDADHLFAQGQHLVERFSTVSGTASFGLANEHTLKDSKREG